MRTKDGVVYDPQKLGGVPVAELEPPCTATVMILGRIAHSLHKKKTLSKRLRRRSRGCFHVRNARSHCCRVEWTRALESATK